MISHMDIRLHKHVSIIQKYWYFFKSSFLKRNQQFRPTVRDANAQSEAGKTADRRHGRSKLVISLVKRTSEKVPILLNNRGIFMEWYIDMGDHITTYFFRIT